VVLCFGSSIVSAKRNLARHCLSADNGLAIYLKYLDAAGVQACAGRLMRADGA
jgi:hypothetical protein